MPDASAVYFYKRKIKELMVKYIRMKKDFYVISFIFTGFVMLNHVAVASPPPLPVFYGLPSPVLLQNNLVQWISEIKHFRIKW